MRRGKGALSHVHKVAPGIYSYQHIVNSTVSTNFWQQAYQGIYAANVVIEAISDDEKNSELLQMKGERPDTAQRVVFAAVLAVSEAMRGTS